MNNVFESFRIFLRAILYTTIICGKFPQTDGCGEILSVFILIVCSSVANANTFVALVAKVSKKSIEVLIDKQSASIPWENIFEKK